MAESEAGPKRTIWHFLFRQRAWLIPPVLFLLALLPRLSAFWQGFITPDEPFWVYSSTRFLRAVESGQWADTFQIGHPGVTTMWAGTLSILYNRWQNPAAAAAHLAWIAPVPWIAPENAELMTHLAPFLPTARVVVAVVTALGAVGIYFLARRLWDDKIALLGTVLIALDPFTVALSGLLHVDALMTTFIALSLLAWLNALYQIEAHGRASRLALLSGLCAGLAMLSKSPAVLIAAAVGISTALWLLFDKNRSLKAALILCLIWIASLGVALFGAFPAMWADPAGALVKIYGLIGRYSAEAHEITFFNGVSGGDPGPWFYPTAYLLRLMPATLIGLALSVGAPLFDQTERALERRLAYLVLWLFAIGFALFINLGAKKFDRYLLPTFPALNLLAAVGWIEAVRWPFSLRRTTISRLVWTVSVIILLLAQGAMVFTGWPYYLDAYNPLAGGLKAALRSLPVGWGEGLEQVADYLNDRPNAETLIVAGASPVTLGPLFAGQVLMLDEQSRLLADMLLITALDRQVNPAQVDALIGDADPIHAVRAGGQEIFWLYETNYTAEADHLAQFAAPTDLILCDAPTPFARHAEQNNLGARVETVAQANEDEIAFLLNEWSAEHTRLWYIASPAASPATAQAIRRQLDTYAASLDEIALDNARITLYILPGDPAFAPIQNAPGRFGALALQGAALTQPDPPADGVVQFTLYWRAIGPSQAKGSPEANLAPFIHLVDLAGHMRAAGRGDDLLLDRRG
ncbi:MAG: glycosyltransferase family 39 protein, partial [Anaerolineae bacterium]|nr:glycosyltransferase family 39 protein [Anaerolineae bacterium]